MKIIYGLVCLSAMFFVSCNKNNQPVYNPSVLGELSVEFDNIAGSEDLVLNTGTYTNGSGESFSLAKVKYYVSNFSLENVNGTVYTVPQDSCYFLIDESDEETHEPVLHVPEGEYKSLSFILGVDSLKNTMDKILWPEVLDHSIHPDMYFGADSGYIFFNLEGNSTSSPAGGKFSYHIGGYGGPAAPSINNITKIKLDLTERGLPQVKEGKETNIHLMVDMLKFFSSKSTVSIKTTPVVGLDLESTLIALNFSGMIAHDHTEN